MLEGLRAQAARLYFESGSVQTGEFELSAHRDNPDLPKSPIYLHYPREGEPGSELLPELFKVLGELLWEEAQKLSWDMVAAVPRGALPLAELVAWHRGGGRTRFGGLAVFDKHEGPGGQTVFRFKSGMKARGDRLLVIEDHTSGGRNKKLFKAAAEKAEFVVTDMLTVVDRQQGGVAAMAAEDVRLHSLFTLDDLLEFGLEERLLEEETVERVKTYIAKNQLWTPETA